MRRLQFPVLCLVTDRTLIPEDSVADVIAQAVAAGVTMVQLREKDLPTRELLSVAERLRAVTEGRALFLVNGRADIAAAVGADGVHLPSDGLPPTAARWVLGDRAIVGRSVHGVAEVRQTVPDAMDYLELGTVFPSRSHPAGPVLGLEPVREAAELGIPILAIGGITAESAPGVIAAGAQGVAVISAILGDRDPAAAAHRLSQAVRRAWADARPGQSEPCS